MSEPTEPSKPRTAKGAGKPAPDPAQVSAPETSSAPPAATQPLPAVSAAAGAGSTGAATPPVTPPSGPPATGSPTAGGHVGGGGGPFGPGGGGVAPGGPVPAGPGGPGGSKRPGLWRQATSTTGGTIAVIVAGCLTALMVLALVGVVGLVVLRAVGHEDRADRIERVREGGVLPPGQQKKLDRLPQGPQGPRGQMPRQGDAQGNGRGGLGNGMGDGMGNGIGPLMRGAMALGNVQHGEFTVEDNGKTTVMTLQRGEVTKASDTSLTVKSADGFTATYVVGADTPGKAAGLKVGDSALVVAEKTGAKAVFVALTRTR